MSRHFPLFSISSLVIKGGEARPCAPCNVPTARPTPSADQLVPQRLATTWPPMSAKHCFACESSFAKEFHWIRNQHQVPQGRALLGRLCTRSLSSQYGWSPLHLCICFNRNHLRSVKVMRTRLVCQQIALPPVQANRPPPPMAPFLPYSSRSHKPLYLL